MVLTLEKAKNNLIKAQKESARAYKNVEKASVVYNKLLHKQSKQIGGDQDPATTLAIKQARLMYRFVNHSPNRNTNQLLSNIFCEYIGEDKSAVILRRRNLVDENERLYNAIIVKYDAVGENFENRNQFGNTYIRHVNLYNVYPINNTDLNEAIRRGIQPIYNSTPIYGTEANGGNNGNLFDQQAFEYILIGFLGTNPTTVTPFRPKRPFRLNTSGGKKRITASKDKKRITTSKSKKI